MDDLEQVDGSRTDVPTGNEPIELIHLCDGHQPCHGTAPIRHPEGVATLHAFEPDTGVLAQFPNTDAFYGAPW
jgi:hypothetical protein